MKFISQIVFFTYLFKSILSDEDPNENFFNKFTKAVRIRSVKEIDACKEIYDQPLLLFHYSESSKASLEAAQYLMEASEKLNNIVIVLLIDCDTFSSDNTYEKCKKYEYSDGFPRISLLAPPPIRFDVFSKEVHMHTEIPWPALDFTETNIYNFATKNYPDKIIPLKLSNIEDFVK